MNFIFSVILIFITSSVFSISNSKHSDYHQAQQAVINYIDIRHKPITQDQIQSHVYSVWSSRTVDQTGIKNVVLNDVHEVSTLSGQFKLTSLQILFDDFAIARFDDWENTNTQLLTLFKTHEIWKVATEVTIGNACSQQQKQFNPNLPYKQILKRLETYYSSVASDESHALDDVHHSTWQMKNHEEKLIVSEGNETFKKRLKPNKHIGYADSREVADIQLIYNCAALIRIDKPTSQSVTMFTMLKEKSQWFIVEKAFSYNKNQ
ncbi:nuclear transport factor 2 family protein [Marinicella sp. W31]|uniref:nuclear transport factor 2 family protein n=1 Tax=Marinicella sp. W31 TaxID=3023713 RepID=UPI0037573CBC